MVKDKVGLVLNEEGYATYPYNVFKLIEEYVKALNWRITNVECGGDGSGRPDHFCVSQSRES